MSETDTKTAKRLKTRNQLATMSATCFGGSFFMGMLASTGASPMALWYGVMSALLIAATAVFFVVASAAHFNEDF